MNKKYLLITSDDFAISHSVNQGIVEGFKQGLLQSSNFMAPAPWFPEAVRLTKQHNLPIGVHLTLTCEWTNMCFSPITDAPSLCNELGYFHSSYAELIKTMDIEQVKKEYRAQIQRVLASGVQPTHVETHMLSSILSEQDDVYQCIADAVEEVASEFGLIYTYATKNYQYRYFDDCFTMTLMDYPEIIKRLDSFKSGVYHLICHCAYDNKEQNALALDSEPVFKWAAKSRQQDLDIVTSEVFKKYLQDNNFELINIEDLIRLNV